LTYLALAAIDSVAEEITVDAEVRRGTKTERDKRVYFGPRGGGAIHFAKNIIRYSFLV
jgi:hypothetical protein